MNFIFKEMDIYCVYHVLTKFLNLQSTCTKLKRAETIGIPFVFKGACILLLPFFIVCPTWIKVGYQEIVIGVLDEYSKQLLIYRVVTSARPCNKGGHLFWFTILAQHETNMKKIIKHYPMTGRLIVTWGYLYCTTNIMTTG